MSTKRWEFFIGDMPHTQNEPNEGKVPPMQQLARIDPHAQPGDVLVSKEAIQVDLNNECTMNSTKLKFPNQNEYHAFVALGLIF